MASLLFHDRVSVLAKVTEVGVLPSANDSPTGRRHRAAKAARIVDVRRTKPADGWSGFSRVAGVPKYL